MKHDLDSIVQNLRAAMSPEGKKLGYAIVGTGMMGREHIRAEIGRAHV